jgi:hypothetical protein
VAYRASATASAALVAFRGRPLGQGDSHEARPARVAEQDPAPLKRRYGWLVKDLIRRVDAGVRNFGPTVLALRHRFPNLQSEMRGDLVRQSPRHLRAKRGLRAA